MAVVVSEDGDEEKKFAKQKLDIKPHRERMNRLDVHGHDIEYNFKDPADPLQLVFVCAMWLTGFDAPTLSTLYLDKPMKDHTLMQTIARANRVTSWKIDGMEKKNGEIIDYYNVFRNMRKALKDYAQGAGRAGRSTSSRIRMSYFGCSMMRLRKEKRFACLWELSIDALLQEQRRIQERQRLQGICEPPFYEG